MKTDTSNHRVYIRYYKGIKLYLCRECKAEVHFGHGKLQ